MHINGKKIALFALSAFALSGTMGSNAFAADSTVNVTGNIVSPACVVSTDSKTVSIPLGEVQANTVAAAKSFSPWSSNYTLNLTGCPSVTTKVNATFSGTADTNDTNGYANAASGGSKAVSTQLAKTDGTTFLKNGASYGNVAVSNGSVSFTVKARLYSEKGAVAPGAVSSAVQVTFTYS
jgi:type 1 fimbria pilin